MNQIVFENILGTFVFDEKGNFIEKMKTEHKGKHKDDVKPSEEQLRKIMKHFSDERFRKEFVNASIEYTKKKMRDHSKDDIIVIETVKSLNELQRVKNILMNRIKDWYGYYNPEFTEMIGNQDKFIELILEKDRKTLMHEVGVNKEGSMGIEFDKEDIDEIKRLAKEVEHIDSLRESHEKYLASVLKRIMPNTARIATPGIAAEMLMLSGSLKSMMESPSSTIQLLGAEKSLFRHLKNKGNRSPKYGIIYNHPLVQKASKDNKGKVARLVSSKIDIAVRVDYFKGKYVADKLLDDLEDKIAKMEKDDKRIKTKRSI